MYNIAITGGIGSGKTTATNIFKKFYNIEVIYADAITRTIIQKPDIIVAIKKKFGEVTTKNNAINRSALKNIIIQDPNSRKWLEKLIHPRVRAHIKTLASASRSSYTIIEVPLLTSEKVKKYYSYVKEIIYITTALETRIQRIKNRDKISEKIIKRILVAQGKESDRKKIANYIITNNGNLNFLKSIVNKIHLKIMLKLSKDFQGTN